MTKARTATTTRSAARGVALTMLVILVGATIPFGCTTTQQQPEEGPTTRPDPYPAAFQAGEDEAEEEIALGKARWLRIPESGATGHPEQQSGLDHETGLPWVAVDPTDPSTPGRVAGHNAALQEYIQQYGLPAESRKPWERELFDLRTWFASLAAIDPPADVPLDGRAALSPDGSLALAWRTTPGGDAQTALVLVRGGTGQALPPFPPTRSRGKVEVLWAPSPMDVALLRWSASGSSGAPSGEEQHGYSALDLRSGLWLRHEFAGAKAELPREGGR